MTKIEELKKLAELSKALKAKDTATGLALAKLLKEIITLRRELGFNVKQGSNADNLPDELYTSIIEGKAKLTIDVLQQVKEKATQDIEHYQLVDAVQVLMDDYDKLVNPTKEEPKDDTRSPEDKLSDAGGMEKLLLDSGGKIWESPNKKSRRIYINQELADKVFNNFLFDYSKEHLSISNKSKTYFEPDKGYFCSDVGTTRVWFNRHTSRFGFDGVK